jgi:hypothetical protein
MGFTGKFPSSPILEVLIDVPVRANAQTNRIGTKPNSVDRGAIIGADK